MAIREITTGQDSFLDIVANLVGVLIILVVVVGANAASTWTEQPPSSAVAADLDSLQTQVSDSAKTVAKLERDNHEIESDIRSQSMLAAVASEKRHQTLVQLETIRQEVIRQRAELGTAQQQQFDRLREQASLQQELHKVTRETRAVRVSMPKTVTHTIEHHPTPISQTVFTNVVHVRLLGGRLVVVPMDQLIDRMRGQWRVKATKLRNQPGVSRTTETVAPIDNFRLQYQLQAIGNEVALTGFRLIASSDAIGQSVADSLQSNSAFSQTLARHNPRDTTISIWVYPESLADHRQLKDWLHARGYKVASWPQAAGQLISGGPQGTDVSAQ